MESKFIFSYNSYFYSYYILYHRLLKINPQIADILRTKENQESISMEDGINKFIGKMTHIHEIIIAGNKIFHSGKLEPIDISVVTRSYCKKAQFLFVIFIFCKIF